MKEQFRIYDGSAESQKAKAQTKSLNGFHPLFTASARRSIALDFLKIWMLVGFSENRSKQRCPNTILM